jgi:hypothetical protein
MANGLFLDRYYRMLTRRRKSHLYNDSSSGTPRVKGTGYGTRKKALNTIQKIKGKPKGLQMQIAQTMYYRAKYHKNQTKGMRNAMKIYKPYIQQLKKIN